MEGKENEFQAASEPIELAHKSKLLESSPDAGVSSSSSSIWHDDLPLHDTSTARLQDNLSAIPILPWMNFAFYNPYPSNPVFPSTSLYPANDPISSVWPHADSPNMNFNPTRRRTVPRKRKIDIETGTPLFTFVAYDVGRFQHNTESSEPSSKKMRRADDPLAAEPTFKCAGCKKIYTRIGDHFRRLRTRSVCSARRFHLKLADGLWGEELSYDARTQFESATSA